MNRRKFLATLLAGSAAVILPIEIVNSATNKLLDWHKDNANILADIKAACEQIERNSNMIPDIICMGHETYQVKPAYTVSLKRRLTMTKTTTICKADTWTLVAENFTNGHILPRNTRSVSEYFYAYKRHGEEPPMFKEDGLPFMGCEFSTLETAGFDVYIYCIGHDGAVTVEAKNA